MLMSTVTLVHPTQPVEIFGNVSTPFWYVGQPLTSKEYFTDIDARETLRRGGFKRKRGSQILAIFDLSKAISETVQDRRRGLS